MKSTWPIFLLYYYLQFWQPLAQASTWLPAEQHFQILQTTKTDNFITIKVKYLGPDLEADLDWDQSQVLMNGKKINFAIDSQDNTITVHAGPLNVGKYFFLFKFISNNGVRFSNLYFPFWMEEKPFRWEDAIMYQVITDRFANGNTNNDRPHPEVSYTANWQGGDFAGIKQKIQDGYFRDLGINLLYLSSPIINTDKKGLGIDGQHYYTGYHSYWPIGTGHTEENPLPNNLSPIEPRFGTMEELRSLVQLAHANQIRVMIDFVANHVHTDSHLWQQHRDWFHNTFICGWHQPINCWFTDYLPDFDYDQASVQNAVIDHAIWMIQEFGVDGFRLDAIKHMEQTFTYKIRQAIQQKIETTGEKFLLIGETFSGDMDFDLLGSYLGQDKIDGQFNFPLFYHLARTFFIESQSMEEFYSFLRFNENFYRRRYFPQALMSNFFGNHDVPRALSLANYDFAPNYDVFGGQIAKDRAWNNPPQLPQAQLPYQKLNLAQTVLLTIPEIPLIYQGDEFGIPGAHDPDNRRMMMFGDQLNQWQKRNLEITKILTAFRHRHPAARYGSMQERWINHNFLVYTMDYTENGKRDLFLVALNRHHGPFDAEVRLGHLGLGNNLLVDVLSGKKLQMRSGSLFLQLESHQSMVLEFVK